MIRNELVMACNTEANRLLFELIGPEVLNSVTEEPLLQLVAFMRFNKEVHIHNFHSMNHKVGESVTHFLARLRAQAKFC